jgi:hypothetical protein
MADASLGGGAMTASRAPRSNRAGRPCPPRCVTGHDELRLCHFDEQHAILPDGEGIRVCTAAVHDPGRYADRAPFVMLHGTQVNGPGALAMVLLREAEDLTAIIGMLAAATPDQHRELAEATHAPTAVIARAGAWAPRAGQW